MNGNKIYIAARRGNNGFADRLGNVEHLSVKKYLLAACLQNINQTVETTLVLQTQTNLEEGNFLV